MQHRCNYNDLHANLPLKTDTHQGVTPFRSIEEIIQVLGLHVGTEQWRNPQ